MKKRTLLGLLTLAGAAPMRPALAVPTALNDLSVSKTAPSKAEVGQNLTYNIEASTNGLEVADNAQISDVLPAGTTFVSATQTSGSKFDLTTPEVGSGGTVTAKIASFGLNNVLPTGKILNVNGTVFFTSSDDAHGTELWKSDGTQAGTMLVKDLLAGSGSSSPDQLTGVGDTLYFTAEDENENRQLWKSDGTAAGTVLIVIPDSPNASPDYLTAVGSSLYFAATDGTNGTELWKTDVTQAGTVLVKDIAPGSEGSFPRALTNVGGTLYFSAFDGDGDLALWKSDGTESGTTKVKIFTSDNYIADINRFTAVGDTLYFVSNQGTDNYELWKSDGTTAGTVQVKDINPDGSSYPGGLTPLGDTLYFSATDGTDNNELWKTDGTEEGTVQVKDINPGGSSSPNTFGVLGNTLFFNARDADSAGTGTELWKTDGTEEGTVQVKDINPGSGSSYPDSLTAVGDTIYFSAEDGTNGTELWKTDGTQAGTVLVKNIAPGGSSSNPLQLTNVDGTLFFSANPDESNNVLFKSDGSESGTLPVRALVPETARFEIVVKLGADAAGTLSNTATIGSDTPDADASNDSSTATTTVAPNAKPVVTILTPTNKQTLSITAFNSVTGSATDNVGVDRVFVKLIRTREGVRAYWNGEAFTEVPTLLPVDLSNPGGTSTAWRFEVSPELKAALDAGAYAAYAYAQDAAGNLSGAYTRNFTLSSDDTKPVAAITLPTYRQTLSIAAFNTIAGTASDNVGVTSVQFKLFRTVDGAVQYWNGVDKFTTSPTLVSGTLSNAGDKFTKWNYPVTPALKSALTAGSYLVYAYAKDAAGNQSATVSRNFVLSSDNDKPSVPVISTPAQGQIISTDNFNGIGGTVSDNLGVTQVLLRLYRVRGGVTQYWNGTAFTPTAATFEAELDAPNSESTVWSYTVTPKLRGALDDGAYGIQAYGRDAANNQSAAASRTFKFIVPAPLAPKEDSAPQASSANNS